MVTYFSSIVPVFSPGENSRAVQMDSRDRKEYDYHCMLVYDYRRICRS